MISKTVTQTQQFLRLPLETQALYFHLIQNTDDDGVVEAFLVVRMIGASEDGLGLLVIKNFIRPLNDEMVYFVTDFHEQNSVRKDRYTPSIYKHLLEKPPEKYSGLPLVDQVETNGLPNISKYNISKYNISEVSRNNTPTTTAANSFEELSKYYQQEIGVISPVQYEQLADYLTSDKMEIEVIKTAIRRAADNAKRSFGYVNAILRNWRQNGIITMTQVNEEEKNYQTSRQETQQTASKQSNFPEVPF